MRGLTRLVAACAALLGAGGALAESAPSEAIKVTGISVDVLGGTTLVEIVSSKPLQARVFSLADQNPRVVVDFPSVIWMFDGVRTERGERAGAGSIVKYRYAQNSPTRSRLVFEVSGPVSIKTEGVSAGGRSHLKLALGSTDPNAFSKASGFPAPPQETAAIVVAETPKTRRRVIILDAGHGGKDPGALAVSGSQEKNITLAAAKQLSALLESTGRYKVVMTREDDIFIPLEKRVEIARTAKADLFLSLHADSGDNPQVKGASVYTLSEAGTARAKNIMTAQDWELDLKNVRTREVSDILVDLAQRDTKNQSSVFARKLIPRLQNAGASVLENTHRNAGFYVLLAPDVPAVLLEMGFLTNEEDASSLGSAKDRSRLMGAVASAIDDYFTPVVQTQSASR